MNTETSARIGIVGLGTIGHIHATRLARLDCTLLGADLDDAARDSFAEEFGAETYPDHGALLEAGVDAVIIGVPNRFHEQIAVDALEAGVDVLLEKPMAHSLESAERVAAAARDAEGFCAVGFTMRFSPVTERVVSLREAGRFGSFSHAHVEYLRRGGVPRAGGWFVDESLAGGGVLMDLGVHIIDLALHLLEYPAVVEVSGRVRSEFGEYDVDDSASAFLRCADGETITVETAWHGTAEPSRACVLRGTEAGARFDVGESELTVVDADPDTDPERLSVEEAEIYDREAEAFLEMVAREREPSGTVEEALAVQRILHAVYESSERGRAVTLEER